MILYIDCAFREGSRTKELAEYYMAGKSGSVQKVDLGKLKIEPLLEESLKKYNKAVGAHEFSDSMFDIAKQFAEADEIVIAAPFWNYSIPAALHTYLEMVCSQGVTFDIGSDGIYFSLCKAKKLTFITTSGGFIPEADSAFSYIKSLCDVFWNIRDVHYYKAEGLDIIGNDVSGIMNAVKAEMDKEK